ncbi:MAG: hypothetical protein ACE5J0_00285 [Candidatus Paceibacterales bacterium]
MKILVLPSKWKLPAVKLLPESPEETRILEKLHGKNLWASADGNTLVLYIKEK